jgi:hypothetical protein
MDNTWICQACNWENKPEAKECARCGKPFDADTILSLITRTVPAIQLEAPRPEQASILASLPADALALSVVGQERPIVVKDSHRITLGRHAPGQPPPSVDLGDYDALELGVSRQHATITFIDGLCTVQDMGSTNGTWLNERRLPPHKFYPLHSGDQLRLGQLRMYVYFHTNHALDKQVTDEVVLRDWTLELGQQNLTPHYVNTTLCPYLNALMEVQTVFDRIRGRESTEVSILSIKYPPNFSMSLRGAAEAIRMVEEVITPHCRGGRAVSSVSDSKEASPTGTSSREKEGDQGAGGGKEKEEEAEGVAKQPVGATKHIGMTGNEKPLAMPEHLLRQLAMEAVARINPGLLESERLPFAESLIPPIRILASSTIEISRK